MVEPSAPKEELQESKQLMVKVKEAGIAGVISYAVWECAFWGASVPVCIITHRGIHGR